VTSGIVDNLRVGQTARATPSAEPLTDSRTRAATLLFASLLLLPLTRSPELASVVVAAALGGWVALNDLRVPRGLLRLSWPLLLIVVIGLFGASDHPLRSVARDVWYLGKSIVFLVAGFVFGWYVADLRRLLRVFVVGALAAATLHVLQFVFNPELFNESLTGVRHEAGRGYLITAIALGMLLSYRRSGLPRLYDSPWVERACVVLCLGSLVLSFSRTFFVCLLIMVFAAAGGLSMLDPRRWTARRVRQFAAMAAAALILGVVGYQAAVRTEKGTDFISKLGRSLDELSVREYRYRGDITLNWRGYETRMVLQDYREATGIQQLVGKGYGTLVDMGMHMKLGDSLMRYVPVVHNGYAYLLIKTGLIGLLLYVAFFARGLLSGYRDAVSSRSDTVVCGELMFGASAVLLASTVTIAGLMNKASTLPGIVMIGALVAYRQRDALSRATAPTTEPPRSRG